MAAASAFSWTNYGEVQTVDNLNGGIQIYGNGYPKASYENTPVLISTVKAVSPAQVMITQFGSVTVNSIVEIYPSGLMNQGKVRRFICDATLSTLATARG